MPHVSLSDAIFYDHILLCSLMYVRQGDVTSFGKLIILIDNRKDLEKRQMPTRDATVFPVAFPGALWPVRTCLYESDWSIFL